MVFQSAARDRLALVVSLIATTGFTSFVSARAEVPAPAPTPIPSASSASAAASGSSTEVTMVAEDSVAVHGTFFPAGDHTPPAVVLVHGASQEGNDWSSFARDLTDHGIAVLALDVRDLGATPDRDRLLRASYDVRAGVRYVREREDVDGVRVAVIGAGLGANVSAQYAVDDHLLVGLGLLSPTLDPDGARTDDAVGGLGRRPVLLIAGETDLPSVQALPVLEQKAQGKAKIVRIPGAANGTDLLKDFRVRAGILAWLDEVFKAS